MLTGHHYPLGCASKPAPTIETLLSPAMRGQGGAVARRRTSSIARPRGHPAAHRRDELGLLRRRRGRQQHVRLGAVGDRLHLAGDGGGHRGRELPRPSGELQRLLAAVRARSGCARRRAGCMPSRTGTRCCSRARSSATGRCRRRSPRPARRTSPPPGSPGPKHTLKLLLSDDDPPGSPPLALRVGVGAGLGAARVLRLTGPSPTATDGVRLGGREVAADGSFGAPAGERGPVRGRHPRRCGWRRRAPPS